MSEMADRLVAVLRAELADEPYAVIDRIGGNFDLAAVARKILAAEREPTETMVRNGDTAMVWALFVTGVDVRIFANRENEITRPVFREMIDEALR